MPHSLKLCKGVLKEASESVHLHYISCYSTLFSSSCPAGFLYITANLYRQPNWVFSRSHNRFEWSVHIELTALCVGWGMSSPRQANQSSFFFLTDQGKPPMSSLHLSPKHTVIFSLSLPTLSHLSLSISPSPYSLYIAIFCHSPNFSCFPRLRVLWSNCTGSLLMNQMSCRHRKTTGPNCWYAIISVFEARE